MEKNISVGLDIGTTKIVAMVGSRNEFKKLEILGIGKSQSLGVHRGVVNNITQTIESIKYAIEEARVESGKQHIKEVVVGIAGQHIRSLQHSDYITRENPDKVIDNNDIDELYNKAVDIIVSQQKVSTSFIQRYLQIGYNRAARIIEKMEENGIISEANNAGKRQVLKKK